MRKIKMGATPVDMKLILAFSFLILGYPGFSQTPGNHFKLTGLIEGQKEGYLTLIYTGHDGKAVRDSVLIDKGRFQFAGSISQPVYATLSGKMRSRSVDDPNYTGFFLESTQMSISLKADDFKNAVITGSGVQDEYAELLSAKKRVEARYRSQLDSLRAERDREMNAAIRDRLSPYFNEMNKVDLLFFHEHPSSFVTAYMLRFHVDDLSLDSLQLFYRRLDKQLQESVYGKYIAAEIEKLRNGSPGSMAKDFTAIDINGKAMRLSDFRSKYVLIDFWASWCVPCRKGNPHLRALYAKYKDRGLEIIGVSDDDRAQDAWRMAVEKDSIGIWRHVLRGLKFTRGEYDHSGDISEQFGIHSLPTKILVDKKGMIIGRFGENDAELDRALSETFGD